MKCLNCSEEFEAGYDVCWNCGADAEGKISDDFQHADNPVESDKSTLRAFGRAFGVDYRTESSKPATRWDFILPGWSFPIVLGLIVLALVVFIPGRNATTNDLMPAYVFCSLCLVSGIVMFFVSRRQ